MDPESPAPVPDHAVIEASEIAEPHARSIKWIARIYLVLAIICCFFIFLSMAISSIKPLDIDAMKIALFNGAVFAILSWGLRRRASWLPPLLMLASTWSIVMQGLQIAEPAQDLTDVFAKLVFGALAAFFMVQILLFTRPSVRRMFKAGSIEIY